MNALDTAIQTALEALSISWCPAMQTRAQIVLNDLDVQFPCMIEAIETETETLPNGEEKENRKFYLVTPRETETEDVLTVKELHDELLVKVNEFFDLLGNDFKCNFVGKKIRAVDSLDILEAGISFELEILYYPCQL